MTALEQYSSALRVALPRRAMLAPEAGLCEMLLRTQCLSKRTLRSTGGECQRFVRRTALTLRMSRDGVVQLRSLYAVIL